jgi:hypothetical protein
MKSCKVCHSKAPFFEDHQFSEEFGAVLYSYACLETFIREENIRIEKSLNEFLSMNERL